MRGLLISILVIIILYWWIRRQVRRFLLGHRAPGRVSRAGRQKRAPQARAAKRERRTEERIDYSKVRDARYRDLD